MDEEKGVPPPTTRPFCALEGEEGTMTMENIFKSLHNVDFEDLYRKLCKINGMQKNKEAVQLVMNKASELFHALNELTKEESKDIADETQVSDDQQQQCSFESSSESSPHLDDMQEQYLLTPMEPMQEMNQEHAFSVQQSQPVTEMPTVVSDTQTCAVVFADDGHEQSKEESMTEALLRCGGDIRKLLVNQPQSSFLATSSDDEGKTVGQMIAGKQEEKEEEEDEEEAERFVRPPRLHFTQSKEAASDGFPSAIALSHRWHPDHMQNQPGDANLSIRAAFDTKFDEYYVFRHWRPSQGMPPIHDVRLRWRTTMLMIAGHLDSGHPLTRIFCVTLDPLPASSLLSAGSSSMQHRGVVMDIEAIKWCHPEQPSEPDNEQTLVEKKSCEQQRKRQPIIFVRYAVTDNHHEAIDNSAKELSDGGVSQRRISCSLDEIQYMISLLQEQETCVDEAYRTQWKEKSAFNGMLFRLSLLRPTILKRQARKDRMIKLQAAEQKRLDELQLRRDNDEVIDKVCCKIDCEEWALLQCSRCQNVCYCCEKHQRQDWMQRHGEVCMAEEYVKCALPTCPVRVLCGYTDPIRPFKVNEETTACRKLMDAASRLITLVLRHFCSQAHCEEGKEEDEMTMKEYNLTETVQTPLERDIIWQKLTELQKNTEELREEKGQMLQQVEEQTQKVLELQDTLKREKKNHDTKLLDLKAVVYKSKKSLKEMGETVTREGTKLQWMWLKKKLELTLEEYMVRLQHCRAEEIYRQKELVLGEEWVIFYDQYLDGPDREESLLDHRKRMEDDRNTLQKILRDKCHLEEQEISMRKQLEALNNEVDSNLDDTSSAADPDSGPEKSAEQPLLSKGSPIDITAFCVPIEDTDTTSVSTSEVGLKQGDVSPDATHSNETTAVSLCSHPATCQTADWPRHKEECPRQLRKVELANLDKAKGFQDEQNWAQALRYADIAAIKLKKLKDRSLQTIQFIDIALIYKRAALECLDRLPEALECDKESYTLWKMNHPRNPGIISSLFSVVKNCLINEQHDEAEIYAREAMNMINDVTDNFVPEDERPKFLAEGSYLLARAIWRLAEAGGIPSEEKQKVGEEAITHACRSLEMHMQLGGAETVAVAMAAGGLADVLQYFKDVDNDKVLSLREQVITIYRRVKGSSSISVAKAVNSLGSTYALRANKAHVANDLDRCSANFELAMPPFREAARIYRINNDTDNANEALRMFTAVEERVREIRSSIRAAATKRKG